MRANNRDNICNANLESNFCAQNKEETFFQYYIKNFILKIMNLTIRKNEIPDKTITLTCQL